MDSVACFAFNPSSPPSPYQKGTLIMRLSMRADFNPSRTIDTFTLHRKRWGVVPVESHRSAPPYHVGGLCLALLTVVSE